MRKLFFVILGMMLLASTPSKMFGLAPLGKLAVCLDPGHGGSDPGSFAMFNGKMVTENEYVRDVVIRTQTKLRAKHVTVFLTTRRKNDEVRNNAPFNIFPEIQNEYFNLDGSLVKAGQAGLTKRIAYCNALQKKYPKQRVVFMAVHFDVVGTRSDVFGVRIIHGKNSKKLADALAKSFGKAGRLRLVGPVAVSGDKRYGLRHILVLSRKNLAPDKVLIELGNFNNPGDLYRIRSPKVRDLYADAIVKGLANY